MNPKAVENFGEVNWTSESILSSIEEFYETYRKKPLGDNSGGMRIPHMFATWFMVKELRPGTIIESGIWKGQGTWLLRQASPDSQIISLDPDLSKREYIDENVRYLSQDFAEVDWTDVDADNTLAFFDDHQNALTRLMQCKWFGIKQAIFEDNYSKGKGDFYTLRQALSESGFGSEKARSSAGDYGSFASKVARRVTGIYARALGEQVGVIPQFARTYSDPNRFDAEFLKRNLSCYHEFSPVYKPITEGKADALGLLENSPNNAVEQHFHDEKESYNNICYVRLK